MWAGVFLHQRLNLVLIPNSRPTGMSSFFQTKISTSEMSLTHSAIVPSPQTAHIFFLYLYSVFLIKCRKGICSIFTFNVKIFKIHNPHANSIDRRYLSICIYVINFSYTLNENTCSNTTYWVNATTYCSNPRYIKKGEKNMKDFRKKGKEQRQKTNKTEYCSIKTLAWITNYFWTE